MISVNRSPEDDIKLRAGDIARILRIGTSTVFKYHREGKISGEQTGTSLRSRIEFTSIDLAGFLIKVYFHDPENALSTARRLIRDLQVRERQSFMDRFRLRT